MTTNHAHSARDWEIVAGYLGEQAAFLMLLVKTSAAAHRDNVYSTYAHGYNDGAQGEAARIACDLARRAGHAALMANDAHERETEKRVACSIHLFPESREYAAYHSDDDPRR